MKKEDIKLGDIERILFGQAPPEFLLEVFIRALIVYVAVIVVMQWLGKRMNAQLTILEFAVMITMGAILAVPMQMPDRGIIQGLVALLCTLLFLRGVSWLGLKNSRFERLVHGRSGIIIKDSVLQLDEMARSRISRQLLFSELRKKNIYHLGALKRVYFEATGRFSVFKHTEAMPGLPMLPPDDDTVFEMFKASTQDACANCGKVVSPDHKRKPCPNCGKTDWIKAIED